MSVVGGIGAVFLYHWFDENILAQLPKHLPDLRHYRPPASSLVYAADGTLVDEFYLERRIWVPLAELPPHVPRAFIAAEDRRFFEHVGVDLLGIARAMYANLQAGTITQGGSTLTQQLVKNIIVGNEKSYRRKLRELVLAYRLDAELTKEEILELYLNFVFLGSGNYGVEAAARDFFGVSARQLDPGQAALLAGLVPAPSRYQPRSHPELAAWRRAVVLRAMVRDGHLSPEEAERHREDPVLRPRESRDSRGVGIAYVTQVRRELRRLLGRDQSREQGFAVHTALDLRVQEVAETAVREAIRALEGRQGKNGPVRRLGPEEWESFLLAGPGLRRDADGRVQAPRVGECFQALVDDRSDLAQLRAGQATYPLHPEERTVRIRSITDTTSAEEPPAARATSSTAAEEAPRRARPRPATLGARIRPGDVLRVCMSEAGMLRLDPRPWAEGAAVVLENATGRVLALVGGYDVGLEGFVRATQAQRQPGSSFKPFVYAAALLQERTQLDVVVDAPLSLPAGGGKTWSPKNYDGRFAGPVTLRDAMARSLNTVSVRLTLELGPSEVARVARLMGVQTRLRPDITIALGSSEVTPLDQALAYATIARMGVAVEPVFVDRLLDGDGTLVGAAGGKVRARGGELAELPGRPGQRVLPAGVAYELADMLRQVVQSGTARRAFRPGLDRAGKTGTTNAYIDAWFVGFTPRHTVAVWIGTDGTFSLGDKETGGRAALPAWIAIVDALDAVEGERLPLPDEAVLVRSGERWLGLPRGKVPGQLLRRFPAGGEPLPEFLAE